MKPKLFQMGIHFYSQRGIRWVGDNSKWFVPSGWGIQVHFSTRALWKSLGTEKPQYSWAEVSGSVSTWPLSMLPSTQPYWPTHLLDSWTVSPGPPLTLLHLYQEGKKCRLPTWPPGVLQCPAGLLGTTTVWGLDSYWSLTRAGVQAPCSTCSMMGEGVEKATVFSVTLCAVEQLLCKIFSLMRLLPSWVLTRDRRFLLFIYFLSVPVGFPGCWFFSAASVEYIRQRKTQGTHHHPTD